MLVHQAGDFQIKNTLKIKGYMKTEPDTFLFLSVYFRPCALIDLGESLFQHKVAFPNQIRLSNTDFL